MAFDYQVSRFNLFPWILINNTINIATVGWIIYEWMEGAWRRGRVWVGEGGEGGEKGRVWAGREGGGEKGREGKVRVGEEGGVLEGEGMGGGRDKGRREREKVKEK